MKSFTFLVKPACVMALTLGIMSPLAAYAKDSNCRAGQHHMGHKAKQFNKWVKVLDLTDAQQVQVQALKTQMKSTREADKGQVKAQRELFRSLMESNASEAELQAQADQMAQSMSKHMVQASLNMRAFRNILTVEQLAKMDTLIAERNAKRLERDKAKAEKG